MPFDLISSCLANRYQFTCINSTKSDKILINHGVQQSNVLVPILFRLYVNDLPIASNLKTLFFFDDTALLASDDEPTSLEKLVNIDLKKTKIWLVKYKLTLNTKNQAV